MSISALVHYPIPVIKTTSLGDASTFNSLFPSYHESSCICSQLIFHKCLETILSSTWRSFNSFRWKDAEVSNFLYEIFFQRAITVACKRQNAPSLKVTDKSMALISVFQILGCAPKGVCNTMLEAPRMTPENRCTYKNL